MFLPNVLILKLFSNKLPIPNSNLYNEEQNDANKTKDHIT